MIWVRGLTGLALVVAIAACSAESRVPTVANPDTLSAGDREDTVSTLFEGNPARTTTNDAALAYVLAVTPSEVTFQTSELADTANRILQVEPEQMGAIDPEQLDPVPDRESVDVAEARNAVDLRDVAVLLGAALSDAENRADLLAPANRLLVGDRQLANVDEVLAFPGTQATPTPSPTITPNPNPSPSASPFGDITLRLPENYVITRGTDKTEIPLFINNNPGGVISRFVVTITFDALIFDGASAFNALFGTLLLNQPTGISFQNGTNLRGENGGENCGCSFTTDLTLKEPLTAVNSGFPLFKFVLDVDPDAEVGTVPLQLSAMLFDEENQELEVVTVNGSVDVR